MGLPGHQTSSWACSVTVLSLQMLPLACYDNPLRFKPMPEAGCFRLRAAVCTCSRLQRVMLQQMHAQQLLQTLLSSWGYCS